MHGLPLLANVAEALTVDEVIWLNCAAVSDSTLELLLNGAGDSRSARAWKN